jgi:hypothetical protein
MAQAADFPFTPFRLSFVIESGVAILEMTTRK